jgi:hypothetical protein
MSKAEWKARALAAEADVERLQRNFAILAAESMSVRDMEAKIRNNELDLRAVVGPEGGGPAVKLIAALVMNVVFGDDDEPEPPNYRGFELKVNPGGTFDEYRLWVECVKPGGKTSHEIRSEMEARLSGGVS